MAEQTLANNITTFLTGQHPLSQAVKKNQATMSCLLLWDLRRHHFGEADGATLHIWNSSIPAISRPKIIAFFDTIIVLLFHKSIFFFSKAFAIPINEKKYDLLKKIFTLPIF